MRKVHFILVWILILSLNPMLICQEDLFIPRNIQEAYSNGTRSVDGKPGPGYWQNFADYKFEVEYDVVNHSLHGKGEIKYYNNSPDSLTSLVIRLYPNIFKKGSARDYAIIPEAVTDGVILNELSIDDRSIILENKSILRVTNTIAILYLPKAISSNSSIDLKIDWNFSLPAKTTLRMGVYDSTSVFVGYWYPQISVYDDTDGWDYYNYSGQAEFYNDFSNFEVKITVPGNFGVWATGELQNPEEVLSENIFEKYSAAKVSDEVVRIITADDLNPSTIYKNDGSENTWKFKANNVTDFAFALSDHYLWDGLRTIIDSSNDRSVFVQAVYPVDSPDFYNVAEACKDLLIYFSNEMPGVKFPFPSITAFNNGRNGGGMEFPMMINNGSPDVWENTVSLTAHEIAHQYFPFYVGTNEKKYAFMDEGWAVMLPFDYMEKLAGINSRLISNVGNYEYISGTEDDYPAMIQSVSMPYNSYRTSAYDRSSISYEILCDLLGDELFSKALREYIDRWKGKHPTPYDFFFTFNDVTGQNLNWFWIPWFFEAGYPDLKIDRVIVEDGSAEITIKKIGNIPTPVKLNLKYGNGTSEEYYYAANVWQNSNDIFSTEIKLTDILAEIKLGDLRIPDSNRENNLFVVH